jgi:hypothetical protein
MRYLLLAVIGLVLAACNQTSETASTSASSPMQTASTEQLPPIYEPLVDMHRVKPEKYQKDLAECRQQAAPQEAAARVARQQQAAGTGLSIAGAAASFLPVSTFNQARALGAATDTAQAVGGNTAANGAMAADAATADYALVVNTCLQHKKYRLLRG